MYRADDVPSVKQTVIDLFRKLIQNYCLLQCIVRWWSIEWCDNKWYLHLWHPRPFPHLSTRTYIYRRRLMRAQIRRKKNVLVVVDASSATIESPICMQRYILCHSLFMSLILVLQSLSINTLFSSAFYFAQSHILSSRTTTTTKNNLYEKWLKKKVKIEYSIHWNRQLDTYRRWTYVYRAHRGYRMRPHQYVTHSIQ